MNTPTVKETNAVATRAPGGQVLKSDMIVPYIVLGQGLSEAVTERKVQLGDIYRSTSKEVLGNPEKPLDVIFLHNPRADWVLEQKNKGGKFEYRGTMPRNAANETLAWSYWADDDGNEMDPGAKGATEWRRVKRLTVFAILPSDIEAAKVEMAKAEAGELPDPSKALTPVVLSFRSTGYNTGKEIATFFAQAASMKVPIWKYQLPMFDTLETNDQGSFYVWKTDRTKAKGVSKEHLPFVAEWVDMMNSGVEMQTDEGADSEHVAARPAATQSERDVC